MANFKSQKMSDLDHEQARLIRQICEEVGIHLGDSLCGACGPTYESYIAPFPVVVNNKPSPSFVFQFTGDSLVLVEKNIGHRKIDDDRILYVRPNGDHGRRPYMQKPYTFLLADPEFFTKVWRHVYKDWKHGVR